MSFRVTIPKKYKEKGSELAFESKVSGVINLDSLKVIDNVDLVRSGAYYDADCPQYLLKAETLVTLLAWLQEMGVALVRCKPNDNLYELEFEVDDDDEYGLILNNEKFELYSFYATATSSYDDSYYLRVGFCVQDPDDEDNICEFNFCAEIKNKKLYSHLYMHKIEFT